MCVCNNGKCACTKKNQTVEEAVAESKGTGGGGTPAEEPKSEEGAQA